VLIVAGGIVGGVEWSRHNGRSGTSSTTTPAANPTPVATVTLTKTASPSPTPSATGSGAGGVGGGEVKRVKTFYAYYDAINAKDWQTVWALGGQNLGETFDQMVAGYSDTNRDLAYLVGISGDQLSEKLLAFKNSGRAQLYTGTVTIRHGEIVAAEQSLAYSDDNDAFSALAGDWSGHDRDLEITPGGLGVARFRTFKNCPALAAGCDQFEGNDIIDGGTIIFQLDGGQANVANGHVIFATVNAAQTMTLTQDATKDTVALSLFPKAPFCGSRAAGSCGA
jgi:hypothetical protein